MLFVPSALTRYSLVASVKAPSDPRYAKASPSGDQDGSPTLKPGTTPDNVTPACDVPAALIVNSPASPFLVDVKTTEEPSGE
jgi:hypothetical protein